MQDENQDQHWNAGALTRPTTEKRVPTSLYTIKQVFGQSGS